MHACIKEISPCQCIMLYVTDLARQFVGSSKIVLVSCYARNITKQ